MRKIGGLYHWRLGRLGGSIYLAKLTESNSREDFFLARFASANFAIAAAAWTSLI